MAHRGVYINKKNFAALKGLAKRWDVEEIAKAWERSEKDIETALSFKTYKQYQNRNKAKKAPVAKKNEPMVWSVKAKQLSDTVDLTIAVQELTSAVLMLDTSMNKKRRWF